jgi:Lrp/AsnC family transcriptional regulator for asnA, asnC and gidA
MRNDGDAAPAAAEPPDDAPAPGLDELDRAIVAQLAEDGRRPYRAIAKDLGVPETTVRFRARRLQREGVLTILAFLNPLKVGYSVLASVLLRVEPDAHNRVVEALKAWPEVKYMSSCAGFVDIYTQIACRDHEDLWRLLSERIPAVGGVKETQTLMEIKLHKLEYMYRDL